MTRALLATPAARVLAVELDRRAVAALAERLDPEAVLVLADRCLEADYHIRRKAYMPPILDALAHDLGQLVNRRP